MDDMRQTAIFRHIKGFFRRKNKIVILSPLEGRIVPLKEVPDKVFAEEVMGKGLAIIPDTGILFSPIKGRVDSVANAKHAIVCVSEDGVEILIHIGIDTVTLKGVPFSPMVKAGDWVEPGDILAKFNIAAIKAADFSTVSPVLVTNFDEFGSLSFASGFAKPGDALITMN
ncbi:MAG: PTS glucose transporter subunit IIA [Treponema sp.]|jgi:glucose-specific phosphotransferase system IIA component|nr:PTS glucose transporter subunit IIA [Treponema sp.]